MALLEGFEGALSVSMFNKLLSGTNEDGSEVSQVPKVSKTFEYCNVESEQELMKNLVAFLSHTTLSRTDKSFGQKSSDFLVIEENNRQTQLSALISHLARLDNQVVRNLTRRILAETSQWMSSLFKFPQSKAYVHVREVDGVVSACRMALHKHYPTLALHGFKIWLQTPPQSPRSEAGANGEDGESKAEDPPSEKGEEASPLPVIYISQCTAAGWADTCIRQLGLPAECLFTLKCNSSAELSQSEPTAVSQSTLSKLSDTIDVDYFEKTVQHHKANNMEPVFLLAHAGTWLMGQSDNLQALSGICAKYDIWLHVVGSNLAALGIAGTIPESVSIVSKVADSITLQPREWLGIPMAPRVTLYKDTDPALTAQAGLTADYDYTDLHVIPLWANLQLLGQDKISSMLHANASLAQQLSHKVANVPQLFLLTQSSAVSSVVLFQFSLQNADKLSASQNKLQLEEPYLIEQDAINMWLYKKLRVETPKVVLELVQLFTDMYLRFSPNLSACLRGTNSDHINEITLKLKQLCNTVSETLVKRKQLVSKFVDPDPEILSPCVRFVSSPEWAGLAALRYVPEYCEKPVIEGIVVPDQEERAKEEIERLNKLLSQKLSQVYPDIPFSDGLVGKLWAIKVPMVSFGFDCDNFLTEFSSLGKKLEDPSAFIAGLGSVVESMIRAASEQLQEEQSSQFWQEGLLRHMPIVGGLYSWILPAGAGPVKGRSFNLSSGSLESTEFVYANKLQYHESKGAEKKKVDEETEKTESSSQS